MNAGHTACAFSCVLRKKVVNEYCKVGATSKCWRCEGGLPMAILERLKPYVGKPTTKVLMGLGSGNGPWLPDQCPKFEKIDD